VASAEIMDGPRTRAAMAALVAEVAGRPRNVCMKDPFERFQELSQRAREREKSDPTATSLATVDASGRPSVRMVLLKGADPRGFVFFTNYRSRKARDLEARPAAALCIHWPVLAVQVRVEGTVEKVTPDESDAYFATRPRQSQLGAWASLQSAPLAGRAWLLARYLRELARYAGRTVPRPPYWGGYRVVPERIEFWYNQAYRLHDRIVYSREGDGWKARRLFP
jgi:pyridoxamine 5'-phosphate oxidase